MKRLWTMILVLLIAGGAMTSFATGQAESAGGTTAAGHAGSTGRPASS